jgi:histidinol-phosphatase (PHP family)
MAEAAHASGFSVLGFSAHAPLPFRTDWNMDEESIPGYAEAVHRLKREYSGRMEILLGYEMDFLPGERVPRSAFWDAVERDFAIGSVHYLRAPDGGLFTVDDSRELLLSVLSGAYAGDMKRLCLEYWSAVGRMVAEGGFDIVGHIDLVKKNNAGASLFDESQAWYRDAAMECVDAVARSGLVVEVNTGGIARGKIDDCYPSVWILEEMRRRGVRVTIDSDAHAPEHVCAHEGRAISSLKQAGYGSAWYLSGGTWRETGLD